MELDTIFFDLDATLYPESNGMWAEIRRRIDLYMHERMGFSAAEIPALRQSYYKNYGTTLRGLMANYAVEAREYLGFVHDLPLDEYLRPEPELRQMLLSLPGSRWVFTNSDLDHAQRVLAKMNIANCFEGIIDVYTLEPYCKPMTEAYQIALRQTGTSDPRRCALLEDSVSNLATARDMGFFTVLVGSNGIPHNFDRSIEDIHQLREKVPELWK
ncbi:MAG: pyrimidine 5'-nucleotidase [Anaerolineae bacterium]|nr:pyrimidine 5'-nucleotidase [Anaerolineae bacterium]MBL6965012.1 pyrimidine 5'-nucleotidase [Anaerolineales bacterium]